MGELITGINIYDIVENYNKQKDEIPELKHEIDTMCEHLKSKCSVMGAYGGTVFKNDFSRNDVGYMQEVLKKSGWRFVYEKLNIEHIAPQTHLREFEKLLENPPEFTVLNIRNVFKEYVVDARGMMLQAFAEIFCKLDSYYKSHSNIKVGIKGLPKRVIVGYCNSLTGYGAERVADIINTIMRFRGQPHNCITHWQANDLIKKGIATIGTGSKKREISLPYEGIDIRYFNNGNCHVIFDKQALNDINLALAEYYGDVLPDAYEHSDKKEDSKELAKDLQFYRTPKDAVLKLIDSLNLYKLSRRGTDVHVLEPSCGDGAIMDELRKALPKVNMLGIEVNAERCSIARAKGHSVMNSNFLEYETRQKYDVVVMNPPFYGKHYAKHIRHAYNMLKEDGVLVSILPITAKLNHGILDEEYSVRWQELPLGSFKESGTNINTVIATIYK